MHHVEAVMGGGGGGGGIQIYIRCITPFIRAIGFKSSVSGEIEISIETDTIFLSINGLGHRHLECDPFYSQSNGT